MGKEFSPSSEKSFDGLLGYNKGQRTFSLDVEGNITLGTEASGQIVMDFDGGQGDSAHAKISNSTMTNYWDLTDKEFLFYDENSGYAFVMDDENGVYVTQASQDPSGNIEQFAKDEDGKIDLKKVNFIFNQDGARVKKMSVYDSFDISHLSWIEWVKDENHHVAMYWKDKTELESLEGE